MDAVRRIGSAEDRRDVSALGGGEEAVASLPRYNEAVATGGAEAGKAKLTALYKAVAEGTHKAEGKRLHAPDGTWMEKTSLVPRTPIHGIGASVRFPDLLKLPRESLERSSWAGGQATSLPTAASPTATTPQ